MGGSIVALDFSPFYDVARMFYEGAWIVERYAAIEDCLREKPDELVPVTRKIIEATEN